jgi:MarR family 2-MHQ and catechol resistance regulon transcriptional repressor
MVGRGMDTHAAYDVASGSSDGARVATATAELRLWVVLARAYHTLAKAAAADLAERGLTTPQFSVLEALFHVGPLSLGDLAGKLLVTGGNITYVVDRLEEQGLVRRTRSDKDRRIVRASLTAKGRRLVERVYPPHAQYMEELVACLETDEVAEARRSLKKLGTSVAARLDELPGP